MKKYYKLQAKKNILGDWIDLKYRKTGNECIYPYKVAKKRLNDLIRTYRIGEEYRMVEVDIYD